MKNIEMNVKYAGAEMMIQITPEESCNGMLYPVEADGKYMFTYLEDEDGDWSVMKEANAIVPIVEDDLFTAILKRLHYELMYAA